MAHSKKSWGSINLKNKNMIFKKAGHAAPPRAYKNPHSKSYENQS